MRRIVCLLVSVLAAPGGALAAQETREETWYFAANNLFNQLLAYNLAGEDNVLLAGSLDSDMLIWRTGPQSALAWVTVNDQPALYRLTPQSALFVAPEGGELDFADALFALDYHHPYVLLTSARVDLTQPVLLVNLDTDRYTVLANQIAGPSRTACCRFSEDGSALRYVGSAAPESKAWTLWERDLASGEERAVHTITGNITVSPDSSGERWLVRTLKGKDGITDALVSIDGTSRELATETTDQVNMRQFFGDELAIYPLTCEQDCRLVLDALDGSEPLPLPLPASQGEQILQPLARREDSLLVVFSSSGHFWLLERDGPSLVGFWDPQHISGSPSQTASPDGRWALALDDPDEPKSYYVWDNENKSRALNIQVEGSHTLAGILYSGGSFLVYELGKNPVKAWLYDPAGGAILELPQHEFGTYREFLPDGGLLYFQSREAEDRAAGIYRYDLAAGTYTLLVAGIFPIPTQDLSRLQTLP